MPTTDYSFAQLPNTAPYNRLPLVITGNGDYITRSGQRVTIHCIEVYAPVPNSSFLRHEVTAFEAKGTKWRKVRGKDKPGDYDTWHLSGRNKACGLESPTDIVGPWSV